MIELTDSTFQTYLPSIQDAVQSAGFIAVDLEFLGIPRADTLNLFESPSERYVKLREFVRSMPPCQLGLAFFKESEDSFEAQVYSIPLHKRVAEKSFQFRCGALSFLSGCDFNFNKCFSEGVTFMNKSEINAFMADIESGTVCYSTIVDRLDERLLELTTKILEITNLKSTQSDEKVPDMEPIDLILCRSMAAGDCYQDLENGPIWSRALSSVESEIVTFVLTENFPQLHFHINESRERLLISPRTDFEGTKYDLLKRMRQTLMGVGSIFEMVNALSLRPFLVAQNSLLDILHIYHHFIDDLPLTYAEWKRQMSAIFPVIIDTKLLASSVKSHLPLRDISLPSLSDFVDSQEFKDTYPAYTTKIRLVDHRRNVVDNFAKDYYHDASFDAFATGKVFVKLAYIFAIKSDSQWSPNRPVPLHNVQILLRKDVANRLPIALIDHGICYLNGEDPIGVRPDIIHLNKKSSSKISELDVKRVKQFLTRVYKDFRVDIKRSDCGRYILIATNTRSTFAKISSYYSQDDIYILVGKQKGSTYDQMLSSFRIVKDAAFYGTSTSSSNIGMCILASTGVLLACGAAYISYSSLRK